MSLGLGLGLVCLSLDYILIACHSKSIQDNRGHTHWRETNRMIFDFKPIKSIVTVKKLCIGLCFGTTNYPLLILGRGSWSLTSKPWSWFRFWTSESWSWSWRSKSWSWSWVLESTTLLNLFHSIPTVSWIAKTIARSTICHLPQNCATLFYSCSCSRFLYFTYDIVSTHVYIRSFRWRSASDPSILDHSDHSVGRRRQDGRCIGVF